MVSLQKLRSRRDVAYAGALRAQDRMAVNATERNRNAAARAWDAYGRADRAYREALAATKLRPRPDAPISFERLMGE